MTERHPDEVGRERPPADPTLKVARPPVPGRAVRAEVADGSRPTPPVRHDEPTVTITPQVRTDPRRTLEFGTPVPVKVTVGPRPRRRRRYRTWPWILAVALALVVLGIVLLVMLLQGETIDADTDLIGAGRAASALMAASTG